MERLVTKLRIIAGNLRGSKLLAPEGDNTRPTTDRIKTTMFNVIAFDIAEVDVLDLFAGSGSLGFECLSRGAKSATFLDIDKNAIGIIRKNAEKLRVNDNSEILNKNYEDYLKSTTKKFGLIFLDPPYSKGIHQKALELISQNDCLTADGIIVLEISSDDNFGDLQALGFEVFKEKSFQRTTLFYIRKV